MPTTKKETSDCGGIHRADVNTQNDLLLRVLALLGRIAEALEESNEQARNQTRVLSDIADTLSEQ